jgi:hypothetical protein
MAATILNSARAVEMAVYVVRAFVRLRRVLASHTDLARELEALKRFVATLDADTERQFDQVYEARSKWTWRRQVTTSHGTGLSQNLRASTTPQRTLRDHPSGAESWSSRRIRRRSA